MCFLFKCDYFYKSIHIGSKEYDNTGFFYQNGHNGQLGLKHGKNEGERTEGEPGSNVMRMMMILS